MIISKSPSQVKTNYSPQLKFSGLQQSAGSLKSPSGDTVSFQNKEINSPVSFRGIAYFVRSDKGRFDLLKYFQEVKKGLTTYCCPEEVDLPDLKPGQKIDRIVLHWTATNKITPGPLTRYHYLVDREDGNQITKGAFSICDNARKIDDNSYAAHVYNANSHSIGISMIGMKDAVEGNAGNYPITEDQFDQSCKLIARMIEKYNLDPNCVLSHYELGVIKGDKNKEKIDIKFLPWDSSVKTEDIGDYIRERVKSYLGRCSYSEVA